MKRRPLLVFAQIVLLAYVPHGAAAQDVTLTRAAPEDVGMSSELLQAGVSLFRDAVAVDDLVGAVILVAKDGKVVLHEAIGMRDHDRGLPMELNTMFRMASNTKPVISTAVGMLVDDEVLTYDDLVREHIPSWDNYRAGWIDIGHLLSHTSGLRISTLFLQPMMQPSAEHPDAPTLQLEAARFGEVGAIVPPGTSYSYNNPGFNTLGALIEIGSGQLLEEYLEEAIYAPLGMDDTYHHEIDEKLDGKLQRMGAVYYQRQGGGWVPGWTPGDPPQVPFVRASGGLISTAWDYAIFCQMYLNGGIYGGVRILEEETVAEITSPKTDRIGGSELNPRYYGYGWGMTADGVYSHNGSDGTIAWVDPANDLIGIVLTQTPNGENPRDRFWELVRTAVSGS